ncbi:hypothetical protein PAT3040_06731 [Paenibacillus agaridevorans]|uniref:Uncharacterized protein n=1 Tax=Paenibacillus agaridevorans TaxID=171404 RepID=A0A2R5EYY4_9BACL|nr:hypothetical protein PAT3040_06731 [Paenibacillus agaridevorans]
MAGLEAAPLERLAGIERADEGDGPVAGQFDLGDVGNMAGTVGCGKSRRKLASSRSMAEQQGVWTDCSHCRSQDGSVNLGGVTLEGGIVGNMYDICATRQQSVDIIRSAARASNDGMHGAIVASKASGCAKRLQGNSP